MIKYIKGSFVNQGSLILARGHETKVFAWKSIVSSHPQRGLGSRAQP